MKKYFLLVAFLIVGALIALKFKQSSVDRLSQVVESTENAMNQVASRVGEQVTNSVDSLEKTAENVGGQVVSLTKDSVNQVAEQAGTAADQAISKVKDQVANAAQDASAQVGVVAENVKNMANDAANTISNTATDIATKIKTDLVRDETGKISKIQTPNIEFEANKTVLKDSSKTTLNEVAQLINKTSEFKKIQVEGYTDNSGNAVLNKDLSQKRAESVLAYLTSVGVSKEKLEAKGFGSEKPIATNDTLEGRSINRRVEFKVTQ